MPNKTVVQQQSQNFETLREAFLSGDVSLMDCTLRATGEHVAVICAVHPVDGKLQFTPFAMFFNGNPYELLDPPA